MGPTKPNEDEHDSSVAGVASGVRVDRERDTAPAPANSGEVASFPSDPSERPTSVPEYDVAAHAFEFETTLGRLAPPRLPLDVAIPTRTQVVPPPNLELRAGFLLLHVDGRSSVREIAELSAIPLDQVLASFLDLTAAGLVELGGAPQASCIPSSGSRKKSDP
jgi:hypothetical protein